MFIPLIFACTLPGINAPTVCENIPEKIRASRFERFGPCMAFVQAQAPKVVAQFGDAAVFITIRCASLPDGKCHIDREPERSTVEAVPLTIQPVAVPFARGGADCTGAGEQSA
jgi:hypothetical protein